MGKVIDLPGIDVDGLTVRARDLLREAVQEHGENLVFASSLSVEDQVITDIVARDGLDVPILTLDTGRLPQETYDLIDRTSERYGIRLQVVFPAPVDVEALVNEAGVNCFCDSVELRRRCCHARKVLPLHRILAGKSAWICGLRRAQAMSRDAVSPQEWDETNGIVRYCPLADWSDQQVWGYAKKHGVPYSSLHDRGYPSIGCACCTRPVDVGDDPRSGRWWWESPEHKECGLHARHGNEDSRPTR